MIRHYITGVQHSTMKHKTLATQWEFCCTAPKQGFFGVRTSLAGIELELPVDGQLSHSEGLSLHIIALLRCRIQ